MFGASTERALAEFQEGRGLHVHGRCDERDVDRPGRGVVPARRPPARAVGARTCAATTSPTCSRCSPGSVSTVAGSTGSWGRRRLVPSRTSSATAASRRTACAVPETVRALDVLGRQSGSGPGVAALREFEALSGSCRRLGDLRVVIGQFGGMSSLTRQVTHALRQRGATVTATDEPDPPAQAATANRFAATVYVGFEARAETVATVCYYAVPTFESSGGRSLATRLVHTFERRVPSIPLEAQGMRLPVPARDPDAGRALRDRPRAPRLRPRPRASPPPSSKPSRAGPTRRSYDRSAKAPPAPASRTGSSPLNDATLAPVRILHSTRRPPMPHQPRSVLLDNADGWISSRQFGGPPGFGRPWRHLDGHSKVHPQGSAHLCVTLTGTFNRGRW